MVTSCGEEPFSQVVEIDLPDHEPALAVSSHLSDGDTLVQVLVSHSLGIVVPEDYQLIRDAEVTIKYNGEILFQPRFNAGSGYYEQSPAIPLALKAGTYRLEVSAPNYTSVWSEQVIGEPAQIESSSFEWEGTVSELGRAHLIKVRFRDLPGDQFYSFDFKVLLEFDGETYENHYYVNTNDISAESGYTEHVMISDGTFEGRSFTAQFYADYLPFEAEFDQYNGRMQVELRTMTPSRYYFERSRVLYLDTKEFPFTEPVVVHDNVENGHGIFTVTRTDHMEMQVIR